MSESPAHDADRRVILAFFGAEDEAQQALEKVVERDFPLDRLSILGKASSSGDDPLGVYYATPGERMKAWGGMGAFWGGLWGLLTGAAGMFLIPGIGPVLAAGPVVEALVGAAAGAGIGGGILAGGAAATQLAVAAHRMGVPEDRLEDIQQRLAQGQYLLMLIVGAEETAHWREFLAKLGPEPLTDYPYVGIGEAVRDAVSG